MISTSASSLIAALPSSPEQDDALLRENVHPEDITDEKATAIIEACKRAYLRQHWARDFDQLLHNNYTKDVHIYHNGKFDGPSIGVEALGSAMKKLYHDGKIYLTNLKTHQVLRAGQYLLEWSSWQENDGNQGHFSVVWTFEDGRWRRKQEIFT
jgi:hypothetical protein